jgi:hypothetical protein
VATTLCKPACSICAQLRAAVLEIVGADGIEALTRERVSTVAGVAPDQFGAHYATVASCLHDTYEEVSRSVLDDFRTAFSIEPGWRQGLTLGGRMLLERMATRPAEARLCFVEVLRGDHELLRRRVAARRRMVELFASELRGHVGDDDEAVPDVQLELVSRAYVFEPVPA